MLRSKNPWYVKIETDFIASVQFGTATQKHSIPFMIFHLFYSLNVFLLFFSDLRGRGKRLKTHGVLILVKNRDPERRNPAAPPPIG